MKIAGMKCSDAHEDSDSCNILKCLHSCSEKNIKVTFTWIPSHCNIIDNEAADELVKIGTEEDQSGSSWSYKTAKASIRRLTKKDPLTY